MGDVPSIADGATLSEHENDAEEPDGPGGPGEAVEEAVEEANDEQDTSGDVNEASVELEEEDFTDGNGLFSGVEDSEPSESSESGESGAESEGEGEDDADPLDGIGGGLDDNAAALEDAINEGAARLAVVGLTDDDFGEDSSMTKDGLEEEFNDTFAAFRLGYFGSQTIDEYVLQPADGDVNPAWGLFGSVLMAGAMAVWMRPDGDEKVSRVREAVEDMVGGAA